MTVFVETIKNLLATMTFGRVLSLIIFLAAVYLVATVVKNGLALVVSIIGFLAVLYFIAPELYSIAYNFIVNLISNLLSFSH